MMGGGASSSSASSSVNASASAIDSDEAYAKKLQAEEEANAKKQLAQQQNQLAVAVRGASALEVADTKTESCPFCSVVLPLVELQRHVEAHLGEEIQQGSSADSRAEQNEKIKDQPWWQRIFGSKEQQASGITQIPAQSPLPQSQMPQSQSQSQSQPQIIPSSVYPTNMAGSAPGYPNPVMGYPVSNMVMSNNGMIPMQSMPPNMQQQGQSQQPLYSYPYYPTYR